MTPKEQYDQRKRERRAKANEAELDADREGLIDIFAISILAGLAAFFDGDATLAITANQGGGFKVRFQQDEPKGESGEE